MKKLGWLMVLNGMLLSTAMAARNPDVILKGGGDVLPKATLKVNLEGLVSFGKYRVRCNITNTHPREFMRLSWDFGDSGSGGIYSYSLNGRKVLQGKLNIGENSAVFEVSMERPEAAGITFTNLDQDYSFNVHDCFAQPV